MNPYELLEKIEQAQGTNSKRDKLIDLLFIPDGEKLIRLAFNKTIYGISSRSFEKIINYDVKKDGLYYDAGELLKSYSKSSTSWSIDQVTGFLDNLTSLSGNALLDHLKKILDLTPLETKWISRIILKDLKIGLSLITVNKQLTSMNKQPIENFEVQLCGRFDGINDPKIKELDFPCLATIKYNGIRGFLIKNASNTIFYSRQGELIDYVPEIINHINNKYPNDTFVLDGEILADSFSILSKRIGRKPENFEPVNGLHFRIFDILKWNSEDYSVKPQYNRSRFLEQLNPDNILRLEEHQTVTNIIELQVFYEMAVSRHEEGIVVKNLNRPYICGSRDNWMKIKPTTENTFRITGFKYGTGRKSSVISSLSVEDFTGKIKSSVGAGLTDDDIFLLMTLERQGKLIGSCVEIKYNDITVDKNGNKSLLFPRFLKFRDDIKEPDKIK